MSLNNATIINVLNDITKEQDRKIKKTTTIMNVIFRFLIVFTLSSTLLYYQSLEGISYPSYLNEFKSFLIISILLSLSFLSYSAVVICYRIESRYLVNDELSKLRKGLVSGVLDKNDFLKAFLLNKKIKTIHLRNIEEKLESGKLALDAQHLTQYKYVCDELYSYLMKKQRKRGVLIDSLYHTNGRGLQ